MYVGGIDIGNTNTTLCVYHEDQFQFISEVSVPNSIIIPSVISFGDERVLFGTEAKNCMGGVNPCVSEFKRIIGLQTIPEGFYDEVNYVIKEVNGSLRLFFSDRDIDTELSIDPVIVYALYFHSLKNLSKEKGYPLSKVVITVPISFSVHRIHAIVKAAEIAGFDVMKVVHESCAAAFSYCYDYSSNLLENNQKAIIFDFGGGTLDLSVISKNGSKLYIEKSSGSSIGGRDLDRCFAKYLQTLDNSRSEYSGNLFFGLCKIAEELKIDLSQNNQTTFTRTVRTFAGNKEESIPISRKTFEEKCKGILDSVIEECKKLIDTQTPLESISKVILVGGSSQIPYIQEKLKEFFGNDKVALVSDPYGIVCRGAAMIAAEKNMQFVIEPVIPIQITWDHTDFYPVEFGATCVEHNENYYLKSRKIFVYGKENAKNICIGALPIPQRSDMEKYLFVMNNKCELQLRLLDKNEYCVETLDMEYCKCVDEREVNETKLLFEFLDVLKEIKSKLEKEDRFINGDVILRYCNMYLSFEKYYWLCRTHEDMKTIAQELEVYKKIFESVN